MTLLTTTLVFVLLMGLCVGSFLNVVVYRLPLGKSLIHPPSSCPKCGTRLAWYDNIPVLGWLKLGGKCRTCKAPISPRYPLVEGATGLMFLGYAAAVFVVGWGPCVEGRAVLPGLPGYPPALVAPGTAEPRPTPLADVSVDWPLLVLHLGLIAILFAASLIDFDTFTIPVSLPLTAGVLGLAGHGLLMGKTSAGTLWVDASLALPAALAVAGYLVSLGLLWAGVMPLSFPKGEPMLLDHAEWEAEIAAAKAEGREPQVPAEPPVRWTRGMLNREMFKELLFILPALAGFVGGLLLVRHVSAAEGWSAWLAGLAVVPGVLGSAVGALVGGGVIWFTRILGTFGFGKLAMGLGDVHLMAGVGAVTGGLVAGTAMFPAAVVGLIFTLYGFLTRRTREVPFGPYLAIGTVIAMLMWCTMHDAMTTALHNLTAPPPEL